MKRLYFACALMLLSAAAFSASAPRAAAAPMAAPDLNTVVTNLQEASRQLSGLKATVSHQKTNVQLGIREPLQIGDLLFNKNPRRLRINYSKPQVKTVAVIGDEAILIEPSLNQAFVSTTSKVAAKTSTTNLLTILTSGAKIQQNFNATFNGEETFNGQAVTKITLTPKTAAGYNRIEVWVSHQNWLPVRQIIFGRTEYTEIKLTNINLMKAIPESSFKVDYSKYKVVRG
jgi:outer membrane lipoprotein-sorting protein